MVKNVKSFTIRDDGGADGAVKKQVHNNHRVNYQLSAATRRTAFFSAEEELHPTLGVVLGRPRLGTKILKKSCCQDRCLLDATVRKRIVQI